MLMKYGYMVDYINPNTNEEWGGAGDVAYTKKFAKWIAAESTKTIADEKALALFKRLSLLYPTRQMLSAAMLPTS